MTKCSPRPIRRHVVKRLSIERPPRDEYLTPRLNKDAPTEAIGFIHAFDRDDSGDDEYEDYEEIPTPLREE